MKSALLALLLTLSGGTASAGSVFLDPRIEPESPAQGEDVSLHLTFYNCGSTEPAHVTTTGALTTVVLPYRASCGIPTGPEDLAIPLGTFAAGRHVVRFVPCYLELGSMTCMPQDPLPDVAFVVRGLTPVGAPVRGPLALLALALGLIVGAAFAPSRRRFVR